MKPFTITQADDTYDKDIVTYLVKENLRKRYGILLKDNHAIERKKSTIGRFNHVYWRAAILLLMTASFLFVSQLKSDSPHQMAMDMAKETMIIGNQEIMRKDGTLSLKIRLEANAAFINQKYEEAILMYKKLEATGSATDIDYFYQGIAQLKQHKPQTTEAIKMFNQIHDVEQLKYEIDWFTALAFAMEGRYAESSHALNRVIANKKYKVREAKKLLLTITKTAKVQVLT
jgi:tetratricopeptide (TPR) repeat protein